MYQWLELQHHHYQCRQCPRQTVLWVQKMSQQQQPPLLVPLR
jgi:hypothetical protein